MISKWLKGVGLICLFIFSLFYTEKVINMAKNKDPIMIKINKYGDSYNLQPVNALLSDEDVVPGLNGCVVDIDRSYYNMKKMGYYNANVIEYKEIKPDLSINKVYNKYIIKGNRQKPEVALVFKVNDSNYLTNIINIINKYNIKSSFFVDGAWIEKNSELIYKMVKEGHEIYNMGFDNKYDSDLLGWTNNLIETIAHNKSNYCLVLKPNQEVLDMCSKYNMHTIKSDVVIKAGRSFNSVKSIIDKGTIIVYDTNNTTPEELTSTIVYLSRKGYIYNVLSEHLSEKRCD